MILEISFVGHLDNLSEVTCQDVSSVAQGRSTQVISMVKWIRTSRLSIKNSLSPAQLRNATGQDMLLENHISLENCA